MIEGTTIADRYRVIRRIAEGGMGAVYCAEHVEVGLQVAVKVLHPGMARNDSLIARFKREARAAATIGHDNIVQVLDYGIHRDGPYMVMEYLRGEPLSERLQRVGRLSVEAACRIMAQVLSALRAAHQVGIIHRDLKPENVFLVSRAERDDFVKLLDFGISKFSSGQNGSTDTRPGAVMGTPQYMAPEQALAQPNTDLRADIYSAGVMLYELLTGILPFNGTSDAEIMIKICQRAQEPPSPRESNLAITDSLERVIRRAMAFKPEDRFQSATEMLEALRQYAPDVTGAFRVPLPRETSIALRTSDTPTMGEVATHRTPSQERIATEPWSPRPSRSIAIAAAALAGVVIAGAFVATRSSDSRVETPASRVVQPRIAEPVAPESVGIELGGLPPDALVWLDGTATSEHRFSLPRSGTHRLRVEASGRLPFETTFVAERATLIHVALAPVPVAPAVAAPPPPVEPVAPARVTVSHRVQAGAASGLPVPARTRSSSSAPRTVRASGSLVTGTSEY